MPSVIALSSLFMYVPFASHIATSISGRVCTSRPLYTERRPVILDDDDVLVRSYAPSIITYLRYVPTF